MHTILHISDLHRSPDDPVDNMSVIHSLLADRERYTSESVPAQNPQSIVVSGDVIQGARLGQQNWKSEVESQYNEAYDFMRLLADHFVDGDHSKVVIVPGNHDICWNTSVDAMRRLSEEDGKNIHYSEFYKPNPRYRWSWQERCVYEVVDQTKYASRYDEYWSFLERFYKGAGLAFEVCPKRGYNLFELDEGRILIAGFESLYGNDCFAFHGAIPESVISSCAMELRSLGKLYELKIAMWHHGLHGPPGSTDYMSSLAAQRIVGAGFQLGMHGHHHTAALTAQIIHVPEEISVPIIGAGSLCAGARELPTGLNRQYNIVQVDYDKCEIDVFIREKQANQQFTACRKPEFGIDGVLNITFPAPTDAVGRNIDASSSNLKSSIFAFEQLLENGSIEKAFELALKIDAPLGSYQRKLFFDLANKHDRLSFILKKFTVAETASEAIVILSAFESVESYDDAIEKAHQYKEKFRDQSDFFDEFIFRIKIKKDIRNV